MKKNLFTLLLIILCLNFIGVAQNTIDWKIGSADKTQHYPQSFYQDKDGNIYLLCFNGRSCTKDQGITVNKYTSDLQFVSKAEIKGDFSDFCQARIVLNHVCVSSLNILNKSDFVPSVIFYDFDGNLVKKIDFDATYNYSLCSAYDNPFGVNTYNPNGVNATFSNVPPGNIEFNNLCYSKDEKTYIMWGYKKNQDLKGPTSNDYDLKVYVFDKQLEKIAEASFNFVDVFSKIALFNTAIFDVTPKNKIVCLCRSDAFKGLKTEMAFAVFNEENAKPVVYKYPFNDELITFTYNFGKFDEIFICGTTFNNIPLLKVVPDKAFYFIKQSLNDIKVASPIIYDLKNQVCSTFPNYNEKLNDNTRNPCDIFVMSDGILFSACGYIGSFTFIKYSFTGKMQWIKMINRKAASDCYDYSFKLDADKLKLSYEDIAENVLNNSTKEVNIRNAIPTYATITSNGEISKTVLDKYRPVLHIPNKTLFTKDGCVLIYYPVVRKPDIFIGKVVVP